MKQWISVAAILAIASAHAVVDNEAGLAMWLDLRDEAFAARERVAVLEQDVDRLTTEIAALGADPLAIERAIREDLELARPGEWVVRFGAATGDRAGL